MNLNEFFPYKVCINLDKRPDRWERMRARFAEHNIDNIVRFPALDGGDLDIPPDWDDLSGAYGCLRSHLAVVEKARENDKPSVLIFEDDAEFDPQFNTRFADIIRQVPDDWDMLLFGGIHGEQWTTVADNVIKVTHSLSTYAYALKQTIYDGYIELNRQALTVLDENTRSLQKQFNCYCFMPHLAWVEEDYSDVRAERINLWWVKESLVLWGSEVEELLSSSVAVISYCNGRGDSLRNLRFTVDYLYQSLPNIQLLVLEHGQKPSLNRGDLPAHCQFEFVEDPTCRNRSGALKKGFEMFEFSKEYFIFVDNNVFLTWEDIKANLLKCREYDFATSFREIYDLNELDTIKVLDGDLRWDYGDTYDPSPKATLYDSSCIVTRRGMRILREWEETHNTSLNPTSLRAELLRVYESPNLARRLYPG